MLKLFAVHRLFVQQWTTINMRVSECVSNKPKKKIKEKSREKFDLLLFSILFFCLFFCPLIQSFPTKATQLFNQSIKSNWYFKGISWFKRKRKKKTRKRKLQLKINWYLNTTNYRKVFVFIFFIYLEIRINKSSNIINIINHKRIIYL